MFICIITTIILYLCVSVCIYVFNLLNKEEILKGLKASEFEALTTTTTTTTKQEK